MDWKVVHLLELSISGRHPNHYLRLLTQSFSAVPKNLRRPTGAIFTWYPKEWGDLKTIHDENDVLTYDELVVVRDILKKSKHACLYIRNEHPLGFKLLKSCMRWLFLSEPNKAHLMLLLYLEKPKTPDVIEMVGMLTWVYQLFKFWLDICRIVSPSIYCGNLGTRWIRSFPHQQTWHVLQ